MIDLCHLESLLKVNGLDKAAPDDQIRSVLISARYKGDEIESALMILREDPKAKETNGIGLNMVFRSDAGLKPAEISRLLNIDVDVKELARTQELKTKDNYASLQIFAFWMAAIAIAAVTVSFYMYFNNVGLFHPTMNVA